MSIPCPIMIPTDISKDSCKTSMQNTKMNGKMNEKKHKCGIIESDSDTFSDTEETIFSWDSITDDNRPDPNQTFSSGDILRFYPSDLSDRHCIAVIRSDMSIHEILRTDHRKKLVYENVEDWCISIRATPSDIYINRCREPEIYLDVQPCDVLRYYPNPPDVTHSTATVLLNGTICDCYKKKDGKLVRYASVQQWYKSLPLTSEGVVRVNSYL